MPTGDDDDGSVWATTLPTHEVSLPAIARANVSIVASVITAAPNTRSSIIATAERLGNLEEAILLTLADHPLPDLINELALPVKNPALIATWARGEIDARRRHETTMKWTWERLERLLITVGGWAVAIIIALVAWLAK